MRRAAGTVLLAVVLALAAGCGGRSQHPGIATAGGGASAGASPSPTASLDPEDAARRFAQCMRDHGVDVPDPDSGGGGPQIQIRASASTNVDSAVQACQQYMPSGKMGASMSPEELERARQFAQCMRDHGVDIPDPDPNGGGGIRIQKGTGSGGKGGVSPDDPTFKAAMEACQDKLPGKNGRDGGPGFVTGGGK
jgi:hypothetical protein